MSCDWLETLVVGMSQPTISAIADRFSQLRSVHLKLREAIDESLLPLWEINDGLMAWLALGTDTKKVSHFMTVSVWIERTLFSLRNKPLCSKGVFHDLIDLETAIEDGQSRSDEMLEAARVAMLDSLYRIRSARGLENEPLVAFANQLQRLLDQDLVPVDLELIVPIELSPSLAAVVGYLEAMIQDENLTIAEPASDPEEIEAMELPKLDELF